MKIMVPVTWGEIAMLPGDEHNPPLPITVTYYVEFEMLTDGSGYVELTFKDAVVGDRRFAFFREDRRSVKLSAGLFSSRITDDPLLRAGSASSDGE